jgi:hypothetical protein
LRLDAASIPRAAETMPQPNAAQKSDHSLL